MTRLATNWDALLASDPVNTGAAKDAAAKGINFDPTKRIREWDLHSHAPIKTKRVRSGIDLTGHRCGRLTVIGLADLPNRGKANGARAAWVVRCICGYYETRSAKALRSPEYAKVAMCKACDYERELRAGRVPKREVVMVRP